MFPERIETGRLRLERLQPGAVDLFEYYEVCSSDPGIEKITRRMPWDPHAHPKESADTLASFEEKWENGESANYLLRPRQDEPDAGTFAGQAGLRIDWDRRVGTLGIWLRERFWGRGYSGERAAALMELAFRRLDLAVVSVTHGADNDNSRRAIEEYVDRFGGRREGRLRNYVPLGDEPRDGVRYTVSREEFEANRPDDLAVEFLDGDGAEAPAAAGGERPGVSGP